MIYKIVTIAQWHGAEPAGVFEGAPIDVADGFIHFSAADQVEETAAKHFAGQDDLLLVAVDPARLTGDLRWEVSRGGASFPHLYGPLALAEVAWTAPLPLREGRHDFSGFML